MERVGDGCRRGRGPDARSGVAGRLGLIGLAVAGARKSVIGAVYPLASGAAQFNGAMVRAMAPGGPVDVISWRRMYPPLLYRGQAHDTSSTGRLPTDASFILDGHDPRTWRHAVRRVASFGAQTVVLPWLHPVMAPPYRSILRRLRGRAARVVICHNVVPHEPVPALRHLTRTALRHADLLVTHAPHQRAELEALGLGSVPVLEAFHPRFDCAGLAPIPSAEALARERQRQGNPDLLLLMFGAIRPYKGLDLALDALTRVDRGLDVRLVVAGRSWEDGALEHEVQKRGLEGRVEIRDRFVPDDEAALLFGTADASLLPYRSASQSGVAQLSFAYGCPVIATRVGGLPAAVDEGVNGILCEPDATDVATAIERMAHEHSALAAGTRADADAFSFRRYCELMDRAVATLP
jgi:glycosyltransferase involved in cell wall biosynthesis